MLIGDHWAVELNGFTKSYPAGWLGRQVRAVGPISLKLAPGQVLGLLGPNGSGKSTTLRALAGLTAPSAGSCRIMSHPAGSDAARAAVGYLPESVRLAPHQTGREFLHYCAGLSSMPADRAGQRVEAVLRWTGLGAAVDQRIATYSKGMQQRLGLAQALVHEPQVVLLDEPSSGLDPAGRVFLTGLIRDLAREGRTVVFSSHLLAQAEEVCDRLAILGQGRLLAQGTPAELLGALEPRAPGLSRLERVYLEKINARS
jgi:ABC-type multidrug transport system ATPase subunit